MRLEAYNQEETCLNLIKLRNMSMETKAKINSLAMSQKLSNEVFFLQRLFHFQVDVKAQ